MIPSANRRASELVCEAASTSSLPVSGLFAINKPSGRITMKLLNDLSELLGTSDNFLPRTSENEQNQRGRKRKRGGKEKVKLGQGGTLDPLASGVLGTIHQDKVWMCEECLIRVLTSRGHQ